jgi:hypothetical protein
VQAVESVGVDQEGMLDGSAGRGQCRQEEGEQELFHFKPLY